MTPEEILGSTPLINDLGAFVAKYGLDPSASNELQELMLASCRDALVTQQARSGPVCRWDQIHEMILSHRCATSKPAPHFSMDFWLNTRAHSILAMPARTPPS